MYNSTYCKFYHQSNVSVCSQCVGASNCAPPLKKVPRASFVIIYTFDARGRGTQPQRKTINNGNVCGTQPCHYELALDWKLGKTQGRTGAFESAIRRVRKGTSPCARLRRMLWMGMPGNPSSSSSAPSSTGIPWIRKRRWWGRYQYQT